MSATVGSDAIQAEPDGAQRNIEPLSENEFFFQYPLKSVSYEEKKNGQTVISDDLSALAPQVGLEPTTP